MCEQLYQNILYHSTVGYLTIISDNHYIRKISFGKQELLSGYVECSHHPLLLKAEQQLIEYLDGKRMEFDLPYQVCGTEFQKSVWTALENIPYGAVKTYGMIAKEVHAPKASRAVGGACHNNPIAIIIPCHRVVGSNGNMTGFAAGINIKERLLKLEQQNCRKTILSL